MVIVSVMVMVLKIFFFMVLSMVLVIVLVMFIDEKLCGVLSSCLFGDYFMIKFVFQFVIVVVNSEYKHVK